MKLRIQWLAVLITVASAGWAMGCGCSRVAPVRELSYSSAQLQPVGELTSYSCAKLEPIRERVIERNTCAIPTSRTTVYKPECSSCRWVSPDKNHPAYVIGNVLTAPFRFITGRELGQPDVVRTYNYSEPAAHQVTTVTNVKRHVNKCGQLTGKVTITKNAMLEPVGERLTTVKVIRLKPMPMPVAEPPVCERIIPSAPLCPQPCD